MKKIWVIEKSLHEEELSELDFELYDKFGINLEDTEPSFIYKSKGYGLSSTPIEIDLLIKFLNSLKEKGSNFVRIEDHCDHHGYEFEGLSIRFATQEEIDDYLNKKKLKEEKTKEEKIKELEDTINKLKNS